jgi:phospholipid transport system substrate-binding protein
MQKRLTGLLAVLLLASSAAGAEVVPAETVVKTMMDQVMATLEQKEQTTEAKLDAIVGIITPVFDFPLMAKLTLGRTYWPQLNEAQQTEFTDLFVEKLRKVYATHVDNFSGQQVVFGEARNEGSKVYLDSYVQSKGDRVSILYKLYQSGNHWKIYDLEIQDVSMIRSYNAQFVPVIRDCSPAALLQDLRESLAEADKE